ncbi:MAG: serine/threonine protein kinase [Bryobacteraceae bacterium]|nr:serine/threonine protein kinase [Bryobacteraceae bacterium]
MSRASGRASAATLRFPLKMIGQTIGNYRIVRRLGAGGMGEVHEAIDLMLERPVAIKMLRPEITGQPEFLERFRAEAVTLAKLNHPSIATLYGFFQEREQWFMVMEFVRGKTLEAMIAASGRLPADFSAHVLRQTLRGMAHAHAIGVMHRDIKPANIMITGDGSVKLTDFGIARIVGSTRMTRTGGLIGTLEYIAPERIRGEEADIRSDLYSAGVVLFEMLAGRLPFVSETDFGLMQAHLKQAPPSLGELGLAAPEGLEEIVQKGLAKQPGDRYQTAQEFHDALASGAFGRPTRREPASTPAVKAAVPAAEKPVESPRRAAHAEAAPVTAPGAIPAAAPRRGWIRWLPAIIASVALALALSAFLVARRGGEPVPAQQPVQTALPPVEEPQPPFPVAPPSVEEAPAVSEPSEPRPAAPFAVYTPAPDPSSGETAAPPGPAKPAASARAKAKPTKPAPPPSETGPSHEVPAAPAPTPQAAPEPEPPAQPAAASTPAERPNIRAVRKLYIEAMDNDLHRHIADEIRKQMPRRLAVVTDRGDADAIMKGSAEDRSDIGSKLTLGMKAGFAGSVTIVDSSGAHVLWASEAGDSQRFLGVIRRGGPKKVAERLVKSLREAVE